MLNGTAWAAQFANLAEWIEGDTPNELTPVSGGDAIPFNVDGIRRETETDRNIRGVQVFLEVTTRSALALGASYTWDSQTWECVSQGKTRVGAGTGPRHYTLVRHAQ